MTWRGPSAAHRRIFNRHARTRACSAFVIALYSRRISLKKRAECVTRLLGFHSSDEAHGFSGIAGGPSVGDRCEKSTDQRTSGNRVDASSPGRRASSLRTRAPLPLRPRRLRGGREGRAHGQGKRAPWACSAQRPCGEREVSWQCALAAALRRPTDSAARSGNFLVVVLGSCQSGTLLEVVRTTSRQSRG
jgi:hypothetical protein